MKEKKSNIKPTNKTTLTEEWEGNDWSWGTREPGPSVFSVHGMKWASVGSVLTEAFWTIFFMARFT